MPDEVITGDNFLWYGIGIFAQNCLKYAQKMKKYRINLIIFAI